MKTQKIIDQRAREAEMEEYMRISRQWEEEMDKRKREKMLREGRMMAVPIRKV